MPTPERQPPDVPSGMDEIEKILDVHSFPEVPGIVEFWEKRRAELLGDG